MTITLERPTDPLGDRHDLPCSLPTPRGPVSECLISLLSHDPAGPVRDVADLTWGGVDADAPTDEDLQLSLWLAYELHYRGLRGVADGWEWHPDLVAATRGWEAALHRALVTAVTPAADARTDDGKGGTTRALIELAAADSGPSMSRTVMGEADAEQFREFLVHRSIYHLKEADGHTWGIPRLSGAVKAALVTIQADEYGGGVTAAMHAQLFRSLMLDWGLDARYGHYLEQVPGVTLLTSNVMSMFGLHRRHRGALVGHLALVEMTSSVPNARYARGHRRLGGSEPAARFFDEHVIADSVHEQIAAYDLAGGLARVEPELVGDIIFGARCAVYADGLATEHVLGRWAAGSSSLRPGGAG